MFSYTCQRGKVSTAKRLHDRKIEEKRGVSWSIQLTNLASQYLPQIIVCPDRPTGLTYTGSTEAATPTQSHRVSQTYFLYASHRLWPVRSVSVGFKNLAHGHVFWQKSWHVWLCTTGILICYSARCDIFFRHCCFDRCILPLRFTGMCKTRLLSFLLSWVAETTS